MTSQMMKASRCVSIALGLLLLGSPLPVLAGEAPEGVTITGEVIGLTCYLKDGEKALGAQHKGCADVCFQNGMPAALLDTETRTVYLPIQPREHTGSGDQVCSLMEHRPAAKALHPYAAQKVTVIGRVSDGQNGVKLIEITKVEPAK